MTTRLLSNASNKIPLPIMVKKHNKYILINEDGKIYGGLLDPHTKAFRRSYELTKTVIEELSQFKLFHCYKNHSKIFGSQ